MRFRIDRGSAISVRQQVRGAIEHEILFGDRVAGDSLPSVRQLAEDLGVAPATVSKVYAELKAEGLIETQSGSGTYVADSSLARIAGRPELPRLTREIDAVIDLALKAGCTPAQSLAMINARLTHRLDTGARRSVVMLGLFADATASYAACVAAQVGHLATVEAATLDQLGTDAALREQVAAADLVLTFSPLEDDIRRVLPAARVVALRFIPAAATRMALASIDPRARLGVVSRFADFLPILALGVRRFAAHLQAVATLVLDDPSLPGEIAGCDVLVLSTGAEAAAEHIPRGALKIEYRHIPDSGDIDRQVIPRLTEVAVPAASGRKEAS